MLFYLGVHRKHWLYDSRFEGVPLFVSHRVLAVRRTPYPRKAITRYAVDSGAFTEMSTHGRWLTGPEEYVEALYRYRDELGPFDFAAPQDKMCERFVLDKVEAMTGRRPTVHEHIDDTVASTLTLRGLAPDLPIIPVLQGDALEDYVKCYYTYRAAGLDLGVEPLVGVGSVCRRQGTDEIAQLFEALLDLDPRLRLHGFGVKLGGLRKGAQYLARSDSMAWSRWGRHAHKERGTPGGAWMPRCEHGGSSDCANCADFALAWRRRKVLPAIEAALASAPRRALAA